MSKYIGEQPTGNPAYSILPYCNGRWARNGGRYNTGLGSAHYAIPEGGTRKWLRECVVPTASVIGKYPESEMHRGARDPTRACADMLAVSPIFAHYRPARRAPQAAFATGGSGAVPAWIS
jgi:hypothetical protein